MSDAEDIDKVTRIIALISAIEHGEKLRLALEEAGLTMQSFQALNTSLTSRMGDQPELAEAYTARLEFHRKALMTAALAAAGQESADLDLDRDWDTVMRIKEKVAEARREGERAMARSVARVLSLEALREQIEARLRAPSEPGAQEFLANAGLVWVDWRDDAAELVTYFAGYFPDGDLRVSGDETVRIRFRDRRVTMKRRHDPKDKHRALLALGRVLAPEFELRLAVDSLGGETLAFAVLPTAEWRKLERRYLDGIARSFLSIEKNSDVWNVDSGDRHSSND